MKLHSTEQVTQWHPDKACDQLSDAILTAYLRKDPGAHCGIEAMWKGKHVVLAGEITSSARIGRYDRAQTVYEVAKDLGYEVNEVTDFITEQSPEIKRAVDSKEDLGAGDQGMMFGYATRESTSLLPYGFHCANKIIEVLTRDIQNGSCLLGDAKTQVTTERDEDGRENVKAVLISACHSKDVSVEELRNHILVLLDEYLDIDPDPERGVKLLINPAGAWTFGGPGADCGLTGRKIVCDQYGGYTPVGGGAFSGKDPSKVDRSASYMARWLAINALDRYPDINDCRIQLAYAIGIPEPVSIDIQTGRRDYNRDYYDFIRRYIDLTPKGIIRRLHLTDKDYYQIAKGCHYRRGGVLKGEI